MSSSVLTSDSTPTTANRDTNTDYIGSPSLKSILLKASMESSFIDPDELRSAVDMLIKAIHQNSKGKFAAHYCIFKWFEWFLNATAKANGVVILMCNSSFNAPTKCLAGSEMLLTKPKHFYLDMNE